MYKTFLFTTVWLINVVLSSAQIHKSSKRGLIAITTPTNAADDSIWISSGSDLTWYYNYQDTPSSAFSNSKLQFVPMLFGASGQDFLNSVTQQLDSGTNITHVMAFNEPDGPTSTGGSNVSPQLAATTFIQEIEPLKKRGIKLGAPAVTGTDSGLNWLREFFAACNQSGGCTVNFIPLHIYGDFQGFASLLGQARAAYPNTTLWVTEFAYPDVDLEESQASYNQSSEYLDRLPFVEKYSYFGAFRSTKSNVGPNVAMLTQDGKLTDIGSWYLGGSATNNIPTSSASQQAASVVQALTICLIVSWYCWRRVR